MFHDYLSARHKPQATIGLKLLGRAQEMVSRGREGGELMRGRGPWDRENVGTWHVGGLPEVADDGRMEG